MMAPRKKIVKVLPKSNLANVLKSKLTKVMKASVAEKTTKVTKRVTQVVDAPPSESNDGNASDTSSDAGPMVAMDENGRALTKRLLGRKIVPGNRVITPPSYKEPEPIVRQLWNGKAEEDGVDHPAKFHLLVESGAGSTYQGELVTTFPEHYLIPLNRATIDPDDLEELPRMDKAQYLKQNANTIKQDQLEKEAKEMLLQRKTDGKRYYACAFCGVTTSKGERTIIERHQYASDYHPSYRSGPMPAGNRKGCDYWQQRRNLVGYKDLPPRPISYASWKMAKRLLPGRK